MNEIVNIFLLAKDKLMLEMHLKQTRFTYSACGPFTNNKERIQKIKETGDSRYIYQIELEKACFQHDMAYGDFIYLTRITASDKIFVIKHLILLKIPKKMDIKEVLFQLFIKFSIKKLLAAVLKIRIIQIKNWLKNYTNQLLENVRKEKNTHFLQAIFGVLILLICN